MDLENNRFKFIFAKCGSSDNVAKFRLHASFPRQHGYRAGLVAFLHARHLLPYCGMDPGWVTGR